ITAGAMQRDHQRRRGAGAHRIRHVHATGHPHATHVDRAPLVAPTPDEERLAGLEPVQVFAHH
ncbi:MAG: hypothetical protein ACK55I_44215, partial [bacterium]